MRDHEIVVKEGFSDAQSDTEKRYNTVEALPDSARHGRRQIPLRVYASNEKTRVSART